MNDSEMNLNSLCITSMTENSNMKFKALNILLQFSKSYFCEMEFCALVNVKTKKKARLNSLENESRICLSRTLPNICKHHRILHIKLTFYHHIPL